MLTTAIVSCTKDKTIQSADKQYIEYSIPVYEQESVSHYELEVSSDGNDWTQIGIIMASTNMEDLYETSQIDVTRFFNNGADLIFTRIKAVDIDKKFDYSPIIVVHK